MASRGSSALDELTTRDVAGDLPVVPRDVWAWSPRWKGDAHAGRIETSVILALAPELVGSARDAGNVAPLATLMPRLRSEGVRAVSPNGVLGDPAGASASEGRGLLAAAIADLRAFVGEIRPASVLNAPLRGARR